MGVADFLIKSRPPLAAKRFSIREYRGDKLDTRFRINPYRNKHTIAIWSVRHCESEMVRFSGIFFAMGKCVPV